MQLFNLSTISGQDKLILVLSISISLYSQSYNPSLLSCTISTEKDTYLLDEPIYVEFKQTNIGNVDVLTRYFSFDILEFYEARLIGPDGSKLARRGGHGDAFYDLPAKGYLLKPGESQYYVICLNSYYGYPDNRPEAYRSFYLPPGEYRFKITHYTNANYMYEYIQGCVNAKVRTWEDRMNVLKQIDKMPITSNEIVFHIVLPDEKQDEERLLFMECIKLFKITSSATKDKNQEKELFRKYFSKYETSPYFYKYELMDKLQLILSPPGGALIFYNQEELLEHVKDSYSSYYFTEVGKYIYENLKNDQRHYTPRIEATKRTAEKYPNTHLAKYALTRARELEREKQQWLKDGKSE